MRWLLAAAALLAIGLIVAGVTAGRTLEARDEAVRDGLLTRSAHTIERELREQGPDAARVVLRQAVQADASVVALELRRAGVVVAREGDVSQASPRTFPLFLGPSWRDVGGVPHLAGRGQAPFELLIWPTPDAGDASRVAAFATWGSVTGALALLAFAVVAARGIKARHDAATSEAERRRLEVVSAAGAGLAHRVRNPLATIKATAQMMGAQCEGPMRERAARIVDGSIRIESLVDELLQFARPVEAHPETLDLAEVARSVSTSVEVERAVMVSADREHLTSAIEELIANARAAGDPDPRIVVTRRGRSGVIEVLDRGPGLQIAPERAFEPYVTTRPTGTGLGLAVVRGLIGANGGEVSIANRDGGGCVATITLPAVSA